MIAAALGAAGATAAYAAACPAARLWARGFHRGPREGRRVALTFDDGPSRWTGEVVERLGRSDARATFFVCGRNVERDPAPARDALAAGHEIGNHTFSHPFLLGLSPAAVRREIFHTQRVVEDRLGVSPVWFRPPFGVRSPWLGGALIDAGLWEVQWSVIGYDWTLPAERIARRVNAGLEPGAVVCLHDGDQTRADPDRGETVRALETILARMAEDGYRGVAANDFWRLAPPGVTIEPATGTTATGETTS